MKKPFRTDFYVCYTYAMLWTVIGILSHATGTIKWILHLALWPSQLCPYSPQKTVGTHMVPK